MTQCILQTERIIIAGQQLRSRSHKPILASTNFMGQGTARLENPAVNQLAKNFPVLYETQKFITVFTLGCPVSGYFQVVPFYPRVK